jgi:hypothetical protein
LGINRKGSSSSIALAVLVTIVVIAAAFGGLYYMGVVNYNPAAITNPGLSTNPITKPSSSNPLVNVDRPIPLITTNALNGSVVTNATVTILSASGQTLETLTSDASTGKVTTSNAYPSGTALTIEVSKANYVVQEFSFIVPQMSQSDVYGSTNNYQVNIPMYGLGTFSMVVTDSAGTVYTNASTTYNWTAKGTTSDTFTVTIYSTQNYAGWRDSHDVITNSDWNFLVAATDNSTHESITGAGAVVNWGGTINWIWQIPQAETLRVVQGGTVQQPGVYSFSFTVNKGSFSSGEEVLTFTPYEYGSISTFSSTGAFGPASTSLPIFQLLFVK